MTQHENFSYTRSSQLARRRHLLPSWITCMMERTRATQARPPLRQLLYRNPMRRQQKKKSSTVFQRAHSQLTASINRTRYSFPDKAPALPRVCSRDLSPKNGSHKDEALGGSRTTRPRRKFSISPPVRWYTNRVHLSSLPCLGMIRIQVPYEMTP